MIKIWVYTPSSTTMDVIMVKGTGFPSVAFFMADTPPGTKKGIWFYERVDRLIRQIHTLHITYIYIHNIHSQIHILCKLFALYTDSIIYMYTYLYT